MRIMAIDPGGTTGIATAESTKMYGGFWIEDLRSTLAVEQLGTPQEDFAALRVFGRIVTFAPDRLLMEDFRLFPDREHGPDPIGTIADRYLARLDLLLYLWREYGIICSPLGHVSTLRPQHDAPVVVKQMPGERTVITDAWLRSEGLWRTEKRQGGGPHAMDALRHLVVYCRKIEKGKQ